MKIELSNGVTLAYEVKGEGPNVLFLHGNGSDHHDFDVLIDAVSDKYTCYAIDSRGQGESNGLGETVSYHDFAEDIDLFVNELGLDKVSIVGHSDGAIIGTLLGIEQKDYLDKLVLLSVTLSTDPQHLSDFTVAMFEGIAANPERSVLEQLMLDEPNIPVEETAKIEVPVLVVTADVDVMPVAKYETIAQTIPNGQLYVVPKANHVDYVMGSDRIADELVRFLEDTEPRVSMMELLEGLM